MPGARLRLRRATAAAAIVWALLALVVGVRGQFAAATSPSPPFTFSSAAGRSVIHSVTEEAAEAGLAPRDELLAVDGVEVEAWMRQIGGWADLQVGEPDRYRVEKPDGRVLEAELEPLPPDRRPFLLERVVGFVVPLVGLIYLGIGAVVWWLKSDRRESWALLLYCSVSAALLFLSGPSLPPAWVLSGVNIPLVGATAFHLFTTYPLEPSWSVRFPWLRAGVYGTAFVLAALVPLQPWLGEAAGLVAPLLTTYSVLMAAACIVIAAVERSLHRGSAAAERASIMILGGTASFVPVVAALAWHVTVGTSFPWTISLVGFFVFPAAVGYGIVRSDLFDMRSVAKSSAAYGAVTLAITGLFAFLVTFADAVVRWVRVDARSPVFSVGFLFLAILLFNPLRNRAQRLVDRFFDRERAAYRRAVREISEAMVAMLSVKEIVDRILIAVTDTMGVEGAAVLLLDD
ncbi:MAG: hypothetical protein R3263_01275, partial [Myxococcota bacterium]|nr:hypothetical protein [Myxococcota bacterium]